MRQDITLSSLEAYLQALPAEAVTEVELVNINTGVYDADTETVINIVTNGRALDGSSFQVNLSSGLYDKDLEDAGGSLFYMFKKKRVLFHTLLSYSNNKVFSETTDSTYYMLEGAKNKSILSSEDRDGRYHAFVSQSNLTLHLPQNHQIDLNAFVYYDRQNYDARWKSIFYVNDLFAPAESLNRINGNDDMWRATVTYKSPKKKSIQATIRYSYLYGGLRSNTGYSVDNLQGSNNNSLFRMTGSMNYFLANFHSQVGRLNLLYGLNGEANNMDDLASYYLPKKDLYISREEFKANELIGAAFLTAKLKLANPLTLIAGLRYEHTSYHTDLYSKKQNRPDLENAILDSLSRNFHYNDLLPRLYFNLKLPNYNGNIGFISSLSRPNYEWIIPGERVVNSELMVKGNPYLSPSYSYKLICYNTLFDYFNVNLSYEWIRDAMSEIYTSDSYLGLIKTYANYANLDRFQANLALPFRFLDKKIYGQLAVNLANTRIREFKNDFQSYESGRPQQYWTSDFNFNFNYDITPRFNFNTNILLVPYQKTLLYTSKDYIDVDFGLSYALLKDKSLSLGFDIYNAFNSSDTERILYFENFINTASQKRMGPVFLFSLKLRLNKGQKVVQEYRNEAPSSNRFVGN